MAIGGEIEDISRMGSNETITWNRSTEGLTVRLSEELPPQAVVGFKLTVR